MAFYKKDGDVLLIAPKLCICTNISLCWRKTTLHTSTRKTGGIGLIPRRRLGRS
jgi:hypothetical protein